MPSDYLNDVICISGILLLLSSLGLFLYFMTFIPKRYEEETDLANLIYFKEHMPIRQYLPRFWAASLYLGHYWACRYFWRWIRNGKPFRDLHDPEHVLKCFSNSERALMDLTLFIYALLFLNMAIFLLIKYYWPGILE
ncbi:MAG: hypothetical protein V1793_10400 [Pseudomonadota bacterium]